MKLLLVSALVATALGFESYCLDADGNGLSPEWSSETGFGWYCRCAATQGNGSLEAACKALTNRAECYAASIDGTEESCTWLDTMVNDGQLPDDAPQNNPTSGVFEEDGTLIDCDGNSFTAEQCAYRNKRNCEDYLGDGICDFGQRFTKAGVRTGPNLACEKFLQDRGDCDCPDTMTCDGYCLDDFACAKEAYGFTGCHNWYNDLVCDYGQRTSDFGVSINFDCNISWVPALANMNHDMGSCEAWDWNRRYTTQEYLDNFRAECPTAAPSVSPTHAPSNPPSESPTISQRDQEIQNCNQWYILSSRNGGEGNWDQCCATYPDYSDPVFGDVCAAPTPPPTESADSVEDPPEGGCEGLNAANCKAATPFRNCASRGKNKTFECYTRPDDGCQIRFTKGPKTGQYNKKECLKVEGCGFVANAEDPTKGFCFATAHVCNTYDKKNKCLITAPGNGHACKYDTKIKPNIYAETYTPKCVEYADYDCGTFKKKKQCAAWSDFGCSFIKKKKQKPASLKAIKCIDTTSAVYTEWQANGGASGASAGSASGTVKKCTKETNQAKCERRDDCAWDAFSDACMNA